MKGETMKKRFASMAAMFLAMCLLSDAAAAGTNAVLWVNIGSNSGLFAFDWNSAGVKGLNLAGSPQSTRRGVGILKSRRREIADGAYVMIPICLFSSVVPESYDLRPSAASHPLLPFDGMPDEKAMSGFAGMLDRVWKKEFSIHDYADPMTETNRASYYANVALMRDFIGWCRKEGLRPVFVLPPAAKCLRDLFPDSFMKAYVYDFIRDVTKGTGVKFLDYWRDAEFQDECLYATSLFLNKTGRRRFTEKVIGDCIMESKGDVR